MWVPSPDLEDPLEEEMATHSSVLAWRIPWTEKPGGLIGSNRHLSPHELRRRPCWKRLSHCYWKADMLLWSTPVRLLDTRPLALAGSRSDSVLGKVVHRDVSLQALCHKATRGRRQEELLATECCWLLRRGRWPWRSRATGRPDGLRTRKRSSFFLQCLSSALCW